MVLIRFPTFNSVSSSFDTVADLRAFALHNITDPMLAFVNGLVSFGDGGGGIYSWSAQSNSTDDGVTIIAPTNAQTGRWIRIISASGGGSGGTYVAGSGLTLTGGVFAIDTSVVATDADVTAALTSYATTASLATVATSGSYTDLANLPILFSGSYTDLSNKPSLFSGAYADLTGKPLLSTVATSGSYTDLSNKPSLFDGAYSSLTGAPSLSTVATTGAYSDLSGTPSIHNVPAGGTTGQVLSKSADTDYAISWATVTASGSYSAGTGLTLSGTVFAIDSTVTTDSKLSTALSDYTPTASLSTVATSGSYTDLANLPTLFSGAYADLSGKPTLATVATTGAYSDLSGTPSLATVATTGAYSDLTGKPSLATVATSGSYTDLTSKPTILSRYASTIGDGSTTTVAVTHSIGTTDVTVQVYRVSDGLQVYPQINATSTTVATITFASAPASGAYRVVVIG